MISSLKEQLMRWTEPLSISIQHISEPYKVMAKNVFCSLRLSKNGRCLDVGKDLTPIQSPYFEIMEVK